MEADPCRAELAGISRVCFAAMGTMKSPITTYEYTAPTCFAGATSRFLNLLWTHSVSHHTAPSLRHPFEDNCDAFAVIPASPSP